MEDRAGVRCWYELTVVYKTKGYFGFERDHEFEALIGEAGSAGSGFGERDLQWQFDTRAAALEAWEKVKHLQMSDHSVIHMHWSDAWDDIPDNEMEQLMYPEEDCSHG